MASTNDKGHHGVVLNIVFDAHLENCMKRLCSIFFWKILKEAIKNKEYQSPTNFSEVTSSEILLFIDFHARPGLQWIPELVLHRLHSNRDLPPRAVTRVTRYFCFFFLLQRLQAEMREKKERKSVNSALNHNFWTYFIIKALCSLVSRG